MNPDPETTPGSTVQVTVQVDDEFLSMIDIGMISVTVEKTLHHLGVFAGSLTVVIGNDEQIRRLNRAFRQIDTATDVLSFRADDDLSTDSVQIPDDLAAEITGYLGDLIIAYPYAAAQAKRFGNSIEADLRLLTVHGTLHLLGYDHDSAENEAVMWARQESVLAQFGDTGLSYRGYRET
jgi:probable rRNA maturation factor